MCVQSYCGSSVFTACAPFPCMQAQAKRNAIRKTWLQHARDAHPDVVVRFIISQPPTEADLTAAMDLLKREIQLYADVVIVPGMACLIVQSPYTHTTIFPHIQISSPRPLRQCQDYVACVPPSCQQWG